MNSDAEYSRTRVLPLGAHKIATIGFGYEEAEVPTELGLNLHVKTRYCFQLTSCDCVIRKVEELAARPCYECSRVICELNEQGQLRRRYTPLECRYLATPCRGHLAMCNWEDCGRWGCTKLHLRWHRQSQQRFCLEHWVPGIRQWRAEQRVDRLGLIGGHGVNFLSDFFVDES